MQQRASRSKVPANHRFVDFEVDRLISASMAGLRMGFDARDKNTSFEMFLTSSSGDLEDGNRSDGR